VLIGQGGVVTQLTKEFAAVSPSWAPSGRQIAVGNESPIGRPNSRSGVTVYSIEGSKVRHESPPRPPQADDDLQIDRVIWQADETILVTFQCGNDRGCPVFPRGTAVGSHPNAQFC